jgi:transmembrane sensor
VLREVTSLARLSEMPADDAAAYWTMRRMDEVLPHEEALFQEWLELDAANRAAWDRAQRGWAVFDNAPGDELLDAMTEHARAAGPAGFEPWWRMAAAAALILAIGLGVVLLSNPVGVPFGRPPAQVADATRTYVNNTRQVRLIALPDGSQMALNAGARVTGTFGAERRALAVLSGGAFFDVRHDARRPFSVRAGDLEVTALGTRFDVRLAGAESRVLLVEGRLSAASPAAPGPILMTSGQQLVARRGAAPQLTTVRIGEALTWEQGYADFADITLAEAAVELNRYPGERLVIRDPAIADLRITGRFRTGDPERFGRTLAEVHPVRVVRGRDNIVEIVPAD